MIAIITMMCIISMNSITSMFMCIINVLLLVHRGWGQSLYEEFTRLAQMASILQTPLGNITSQDFGSICLVL